MALAPLSVGFQSLPPLPTSKVGLSGAASQVGGFVYILGRCGSLQQTPMRLGVSPAAAPTPTGVFNQKFEALFPLHWSPWLLSLLRSLPFLLFIYARMWGCSVLPAALPAPFSATLSPAFSVYLCANVGPQGLLVVRLPAPFVPHSASLSPAMTT